METMGVKFVKDFTRPLTVDQKSGWDVRKEGNSSIESLGNKAAHRSILPGARERK